jgi:hypothetical protein
VLLAATCAMAACAMTGCSAPPPPPDPAPPPPPAPATAPAPDAPGAAPAAPAPSLAGWKLTLPTPSGDGLAATVDPARVVPPFLTADPVGALVFWAPVAGATTRNSDHARTELNSLTTFAAGSGRHALAATVTVNQVPSEGKEVILAQIHGADDLRAVPFVMLRWADGALRVVVKQERSGPSAKSYPLTSDVPLGARFDIGMVDNGDGTLTFTANFQGDAPEVTAPLPAAFAGAPVRFQAGAYQQAISPGTTAGPDEGARVTFSALTVT